MSRHRWVQRALWFSSLAAWLSITYAVAGETTAGLMSAEITAPVKCRETAAYSSPGQAASHSSLGEMLYRRGVLPSGESLVGEREAGIRLQGAAAACVACHRRSGYGVSEGGIRIPPIIGSYLFRARGKHALDTEPGPGYTPGRGAYTDESLATVIRTGIVPTGRTLNYLMPRYALDDATMAALIEYLHGLSAGVSPGVTADTLHFATIITPDADPVRRRAVLEVLDKFIEDKNDFLKGGTRRLERNAEFNFRVTRRWQLHVWELTGPPETWEDQLVQRLAAEPVFAVISGLGGRDWSPIHRFCQRASLPCLFPNVDLPVLAENDFYSMYFSQGVLLEAQLIADDLARHAQGRPARRLVQVFRRGDIGEEAVKVLSGEASAEGFTVVERPLVTVGAAPAANAATLQGVASGDVLVLWLRPDDLSVLPAEPPGVAAAVFVSGLMGDLEHAPLPPAWKRVARLTYPADLPERRQARMIQPLTWMKIRHIPVEAERVQSDTYLACSLVSEALTEMLDTFVRDVLLERLEIMLPTRLVAGYYPRLSLAQGQRFASRGGYIVRFESGGRLVADGGFIVP